MKKFLRGMLCVGVVALACMAGKVYAGEKANVLVTNVPNQIFVKGVKSAVTGSSTFTVTGIGTVTGVLASLTAISDDVRYAMGTTSGANVTLKVYGETNGTTTVLSTTPANVEYLAVGTP